MAKCGCCVPHSRGGNVYMESNPYALTMRGVVGTLTDLPEDARNFESYFVADEGMFFVAYNGEWLPTAPDEHEHHVWGAYTGGESTSSDLPDGGFFVMEIGVNP